MSDGGSRFPPASVALRYLDEQLSGVLTVDGDPPARILPDGRRMRLAIQVPAKGPDPHVPLLENVEISHVVNEDGSWHEMSVKVDHNASDVYSVLCGILDRIQLKKETFAEAVPACSVHWRT